MYNLYTISVSRFPYVAGRERKKNKPPGSSMIPTAGLEKSYFFFIKLSDVY